MLQTTMQEQLVISFEATSRLLSVDEIYTLKDPTWLKIIQEDRRIERKPSGIHAKTLSEWFSMWANTGPYGGIIALGISDSGGLEGILSSSVKHLNELERTGDVFCPEVRYEFKRVPIKNEKGKLDQILLIRIYYNDKKVVHTTDNRAFTRRGESKKELRGEEIRELQAEKGEISLEKEDSVLVYPNDFDNKAIKTFANAVINRRNLEYTTSDEEVLELRRLGRFQKRAFSSQ